MATKAQLQQQAYAEAIARANPTPEQQAEEEQDSRPSPLPFFPGPYKFNPAQGSLREAGNTVIAYIALASAYDNYSKGRGDELQRQLQKMRATGRLLELAPKIFDLMEYVLESEGLDKMKDWQAIRRYIETGEWEGK